MHFQTIKKLLKTCQFPQAKDISNNWKEKIKATIEALVNEIDEKMMQP